MRKKKIAYIILILSFLVSYYSYGQRKEGEKAFNTLTYKIVLLEELNSELQTDALEDINSIFIHADTTYIGLGRETFDKKSNPPIYIWHFKTLFFYDIDYWLEPTNVIINENSAIYEFNTCSTEKQETKKYYTGSVKFTKENGVWKITKKKIKQTKDSCIKPHYSN